MRGRSGLLLASKGMKRSEWVDGHQMSSNSSIKRWHEMSCKSKFLWKWSWNEKKSTKGFSMSSRPSQLSHFSSFLAEFSCDSFVVVSGAKKLVEMKITVVWNSKVRKRHLSRDLWTKIISSDRVSECEAVHHFTCDLRLWLISCECDTHRMQRYFLLISERDTQRCTQLT